MKLGRNQSGKPLRIRAFNQHRLNSEEIRAAFVARQKLFDSIVRDIAAHKPNSVPQHHLIVGQRGMGKSLLLQRIAVELLAEPLCQEFLPLTFPEEQYIEVDRLSKFWLNCLDSVADAMERENNTATVREIEATVRKLEIMDTDEITFGEQCFEAFREIWKKLNRRPVLLIDNFNMLLSRLRDSDYILRGHFTKRGGPILIAASTIYPNQTEDYGAAFYEGFKPHVLNPLSLEEITDVFRNLAEARERTDLVNHIQQERPRLAALRDLTGGNPRTALLLFELFAGGFSEDAYEDLDALLDVVTPLYQSRLDQLSEQAQTIVGALARNWAPMTKAGIAKLARVNSASVPSQLGRLREMGLVEETPIFPGKKTGYQIAERFFNIWYLMRFTTRRQRSSLSSLARFLKEYHTPKERIRSARELMGRENFSRGNISYAIALAQAIKGQPESVELERRAQLELIEQMSGVRSKIAELLDPEEITPQVYEFAELKQKLVAVVPKDGSITPKEFIALVLSSPSLVPGGKGDKAQVDRNAIASSNLSGPQLRNIVEQLQAEQKKLESQFGEEAVAWLGERLRNNVLSAWNNNRDVGHLIDAANSKSQATVIRKFAATSALKDLSATVFLKFAGRLQLLPGEKATAVEWLNWGLDLGHEFARHSDAEAAYREAIRINPEYANAWHNLGYELGCNLMRHTEAEAAYRKVLQINPEDTDALNNLGNVLQDHLGRYDEAEAAYRDALRINPEDAYALNNLGTLLQDHLGRYDEAEAAYREAIRVNPEQTYAWNGLGNLLQYHLGRYDEAEAAYREALRINLVVTDTWNGLANLLQDHLGRYTEAEAAYREALRINPEYASAWNGLGNLLADYLDRIEEAEKYLRRALECDTAEDAPRHNLVFLLRDRLGESRAALELLSELHDLTSWRDTQHLHRALFAAYDDNWGLAGDEIRAALRETNGRLPPLSRDDWFRSSAVLLHLGCGEKFVALLKSEGADVTLLPWFAAVEAHQLGNRQYMANIPLEARPSAEKIFDEIERRRSQLPDKTKRT